MKKFLRKEGGFTLIELLVVILILTILIAIAVPSFLNQTEKAQKASACSDNANAFRAMSAWAVDQDGDYTGFDSSVLTSPTGANEPSLDNTDVTGVTANDATFETDGYTTQVTNRSAGDCTG